MAAARRVYRGNPRRLMFSLSKLNDSLILIDNKRTLKSLPPCLDVTDHTNLQLVVNNVLLRINETT
jgi:hypothetical protein